MKRPLTLKGKRLLLRLLAEEDAAGLFSSIEASRPVLKRRLRWPREVRSIEDCLAFIRSSRNGAGLGKIFGIFELKSKRHLGIAALQGFSKRNPVAELSFWVRADKHDKGYASEAGGLLIAYAFRREGVRRLYSRIDPSNRAGRKVIQKLGFRYEGCLRQAKRLNGRWIHQECWGLLREEWRR